MADSLSATLCKCFSGYSFCNSALNVELRPLDRSPAESFVCDHAARDAGSRAVRRVRRD